KQHGLLRLDTSQTSLQLITTTRTKTDTIHVFLRPDACFLDQNPGSCQNYTVMWFFDAKRNECARFWYGGCGGNDNRFQTQAECESVCLTESR
uniref:BPTI/Kunitz inhibitor domain-containing protein n=1 Tax=Mola mola TaxID=94237 RepID=A0A3Q3X009_MOLML